MVYQIVYQHNDAFYTLEWIAPSDWDQPAVERCFEQRYPFAKLLIIAPSK